MKERGTLRVAQHSWHYRLYQFWKQRAKHKNGPGYRENLCHYCRVVAFWGPLSWFVNATPTSYKWLTPGIGAVGLSVPLALVTTFAIFPGPALHVLLFVGIAFVVALLGLGLAALIDEYPEGMKTVGVGLLFFLFWPLIAVVVGIMLIFCPRKAVFSEDGVLHWRNTWGTFGRAVSWVFTREIYGMWWWSVPLITAAFVGFAFLCLAHPGVLFISLAAGVLGGSVALFVMFLFEPLAFRYGEWRTRHREIAHQKWEVKRAKEGDSVFEVAWGYVVAKKHRACPFIDVIE